MPITKLLGDKKITYVIENEDKLIETAPPFHLSQNGHTIETWITAVDNYETIMRPNSRVFWIEEEI